jgi:hypothetical protein
MESLDTSNVTSTAFPSEYLQLPGSFSPKLGQLA